MFGKRYRKQFLQEFKSNKGFYSRIHIISYLPPSNCFEISEEVNPQGVVADPVVLLEIILHSSTKLYRWRRTEMVERATCASGDRDWEPILQLMLKDMTGEIGREIVNWRIGH